MSIAYIPCMTIVTFNLNSLDFFALPGDDLDSLLYVRAACLCIPTCSLPCSNNCPSRPVLIERPDASAMARTRRWGYTALATNDG